MASAHVTANLKNPVSSGVWARLARLITFSLIMGFGLSAAPLEIDVAHARTPGDAQRDIDRWAKGKRLKKLALGVSVVRLSDGATLGALNDHTVVNPASGTKILTAVAALHRWMGDRSVRTTLRGTVGPDGALTGPLVLVGAGDPKLLPAHIDAMAVKIAGHGVTQVPGIVVDVSIFDAQAIPPAFDQKPSAAGYRASIGAAASAFGAVQIRVRPGPRAGSPPKVVVVPESSGVEVEIRATTGARKVNTITIKLAPDEGEATRFIIEGVLGVDHHGLRERRRVHDPDAFTGALLRARLSHHGVAVSGPVRIQRTPSPGTPEPILASMESAPLRESLADLCQWSNNFMAEMIFKSLGGHGTGPATFAGGKATVEASLRDLGVPMDEVKIVNGSGLYDATRVSPRAMTHVLLAAHRSPRIGAPLHAALAGPGEGGTLSNRLKSLKGRLRAKTGTLDHVASLSGYIDTKTEGRWAFSIIIGGAKPNQIKHIRRAIDRLVRKLAAH